MKRRSFVKETVSGAAVGAALFSVSAAESSAPPGSSDAPDKAGKGKEHPYNGSYTGDCLNRVAFPLGGMGAGMICLEGTGALSHFSLRNEPDIFNEPLVFAAVCIKGAPNIARVLEGPVQRWKIFGSPDTGNGASGKSYGLPRFAKAGFKARFPFANVDLEDDKTPLRVSIEAWSPFIPQEADNSSLSAAAIEYTFKNPTDDTLEAVFSFNARNFMVTEKKTENEVRAAQGGFILWQGGSKEKPWQQGAFCAAVDDTEAKVNCRWFRGDWWDPLTIAWKNVAEGAVIENPPYTDGEPSPGASICVPFSLEPGQEKKIALRLSWHVPQSNLRLGPELKCEEGDEKGSCCQAEGCVSNYKPWYAGKFPDIDSLNGYWREKYHRLREESLLFSDCFYDSTLPPEVIEAVAANLTILKSPTVMRQADGKLWCWEGCSDDSGCCRGSCTHVWNYAQAIPNLFPELERSLRSTEFFVDQDEKGHQTFRASLPIRPTTHEFHAASDGQLGGIMKVFREWRISGDKSWLAKYWPRVKQSLDFCIETWDPRHKGVLEEPHHNTYDIEFWGPDGMCSSFYLGALRAAALMGKALGKNVSLYSSLYKKGRKYLEEELFDGEYFIQKIQWEGLKTPSPVEKPPEGYDYSPEAIELLKKEGPKYQYGKGCLSDGVLGAWIAEVCGVGKILDLEKLKSHLRSVHKYNLKKDLSEHANPQRPSYALGKEGGLLLCSWPKGGKLTLPFVYSDEVWTGIEYQVASHLMLEGLIEEGLEIVRVARDRYDGRVRNPFNEYECGHWYARAMASYALLQGLTGVRYDAVEKTLYMKPSIKGDFKSFISTATGFGTVGVKGGEPFLDVKEGQIEIARTEYVPAS
ncbi:MAG TPA: GH116 family glycosyl hydrolase [archaeon]|nr:GH116 family glycosyl hydrolase [archaeon]